MLHLYLEFVYSISLSLHILLFILSSPCKNHYFAANLILMIITKFIYFKSQPTIKKILTGWQLGFCSAHRANNSAGHWNYLFSGRQAAGE